MNTFTKLLIFILILGVGFAGLAFYWTFYKPLPSYDDTVHLPGLQQPADIHWDTYGVPHIYAKNKQDAYYALGYVHAQDRLWQMTLSQITAQGRFAEFFGNDEELIELDKYQRTLGFWKIAQQLEKELNPEERAILQAYSEGVNSYINQNQNRLPVQFSLTGVEPIRWNATRTLAISRLMAWELNMGWWGEVTYGYLRETLTPQQFADIQLSASPQSPATLSESQTRGLTAALMPMLQQENQKRKLLGAQGTHVGSNAWVVDGSKSESGYPMLAGDPHLGLDIPGKWYEVHLNVDGRNLSGATIAGMPLVIIGQNDEIAWSFTSMMPDDSDFFLEQVDPDDRGRVVTDSLNDSTAVYEEFSKIREIIKVKNADDISFEIRYTKHGPVVSDIYPVQELLGDKVISLQWTGYERSNEIRTLYGINWAQNFQEFKDALPTFAVPGLNLMYADVDGNIAMHSVAKLPIRQGNATGFRAGWDPENDWKGFIPFDEMPKVINPEKGWIANANNKITTDNYPYYLGTFWEPSSRIERIESFLNSSQQFHIRDFEDLQNDTYSHHAATLTPVILDVIKNQDAYNFDLPVSYLENWNFRYEANSTAASIFDTFFLKLAENTFRDEFGETAYNQFVFYESVPVRTLSSLLRQNQQSSLFDDVTTGKTENRDDIIIKSMQDAILFLSDSLGSEPFEWRWEQLHTITFKPPMLSRAAEAEDASGALKLIVNNILNQGPYEVPGHGMSVNNGQYRWNKPFEMVLGASIRRISDMAEPGRSKSILPTGQSGNPLSDYYGDQTEFWLNGQYRWFYQDSSFFESNYRTMQLLPDTD